ncbi:hypothetical protein GCM10022291_21860 [Postechiella marina]|uniref:Uncharacterized protein n=1 Tax=Postechiella marina TaxID=943941 RepID=A0ABP8CAW2_9FLAO
MCCVYLFGFIYEIAFLSPVSILFKTAIVFSLFDNFAIVSILGSFLIVTFFVSFSELQEANVITSDNAIREFFILIYVCFYDYKIKIEPLVTKDKSKPKNGKYRTLNFNLVLF